MTARMLSIKDYQATATAGACTQPVPQAVTNR